ncbi:uncharacterized protein LOC126889439 isoform X2 [Diabrotica virgifera virgifera]|nr:uncharacterized protein LOC126889439 isoform X2 [Diabrotica virgifera virgifera]
MTNSEKGCHIKGEKHEKNACIADSAVSIQSSKTEKRKNVNTAGELTRSQIQQNIGSHSCCGDCSVKSLKNKETYRDPSPAASCKSVTSVKSSASRCEKKENYNRETHRDPSPAPSCKSVSSVKSSISKCDKNGNNTNRVPSPAPSCKSVTSVKSSASKRDKNEQNKEETHRDPSPSPSCKSAISVLSSSSKCHKKDQSKNKETPKVMDPSTIRAELIAGVLLNNCDCVKKNGLQDFCPRYSCHKS